MGETCCDRANGTGKCATSCIGKSCKNMVHTAQLVNIVVALMGPMD